MKKTIVTLLLGVLLLTSGCTPFILSASDAAGIFGGEPVHLRPAKAVNEPDYENCEPGSDVDVDEIFALTNEERMQNGLPKLSLSPTLCDIAQLRAADMADNGYFSHVSPEGETAFTLLQEYGILYFDASENLGKGNASNECMVDKWMQSPLHQENILTKAYHQLGVGIAVADDGTTYWVQVFTN